MRIFLASSVIGLSLLAQPAPPPAAGAGVFSGEVERVATGLQFTEGPVWMPEGYLLFSDIPANRIYRLVPGAASTVWRADSGSSNGLTLDRSDLLIACEHGNRRVSVTRAGGVVEALAERWEGARFNSPNDAAVRTDGSIYFTDPPYGLGDRPREIAFQGVYRIRPDGRIDCLVKDFVKPNGIALSPDESVLYVADTEANHVRCFAVAPDGALGAGRVLADVKTPDGMKVDRAGRLFVTSGDGVVVVAPDGARVTVLAVPETPANCAFGDADAKTLYITARNSVYRVRLATPGILPGKAGSAR
jgi:gluconolactonase